MFGGGAFGELPFAAVSIAAGIAIDAAGSGGYIAADADYLVSRTCTGSDLNLAVDVTILGTNTATVTSITDDDGGGNVPLVFIGRSPTSTGVGVVESWGLAGPVTGTKNFRVILSGAVASIANWVSRTYVHQISPTAGYVSATAINVGAADATVDVVTAADGSWIHAALVTNDTAVTASLTSRNNVSEALVGSGANEDSGPKTPGTYAAGYSGVGAAQTWAIGGYELRPVSASSLLRTGTGTFTIGAATLSGSATFITTTRTATGSFTVGRAALSGSSTFSAGTKTAVGTLTSGIAAFAGTATFSAGTKTAVGVLTVGEATFDGSATFSAGTKTAVGAFTVGHATISASSTFTAPIYSGVGSFTIGRAVFAGTAIFATVVYSGSAALVAAHATFSAVATFVSPIYTASANLTIGRAVFDGVAAFAPVSTGGGLLMLRRRFITIEVSL